MVVVEEQELCGWIDLNCTRVLGLRSARSLRKIRCREKHIYFLSFLGRVYRQQYAKASSKRIKTCIWYQEYVHRHPSETTTQVYLHKTRTNSQIMSASKYG